MFNFAPILIGAAVGAGTSALFGRDPLKGAALGGLGGGLFGGAQSGVGNLINGIGTNALAGGDVAKGLAINASALGGAQGLGAAAVPSAVTQSGLTFNPATGSFLNPEYFAMANTANPIYTGAGSLGSQLSTGIGSLLDTPTVQGLREYMPSGQAIGNLGLNLGTQSMMRPPMQAPAGGISQGKPLDISAVENLLSKRRKTQPSLLTDYFG